jgi:hypothetical protein
MNILGYLGGTPASIKEPIPTDLEIALQRMHSDHRLAMEAIKLLTDIAQSNASGNLSMSTVHQERHATALNMLRDLKRTIVTSESKHFAAFELAMRPVTRDMEALNDKVLNVEGEMFALRSAINNDREAQLVIQNTKLNAIAERLDDLVRILKRVVIKDSDNASPTPPAAPQKRIGRPVGKKNRTPEERYLFLKERVHAARPGGKAQKKWQRLLTEYRNRTGMGS